MISIYILSFVGLIASFYAAYVERKSQSKDYHAVCDINNKFSCTKAFKSEYGKPFGFSNGVAGIIFYFFMLVLAFLNLVNFIFYFSLLSVLGSIYLWYILAFKVKTVCVVCYSVYLINLLLLFFSYIGRA